MFQKVEFMRNLRFLLVSTVAGALTGLILNAINVYLSPIYFEVFVRATYPALGPGFDALLIGMRDGSLAGLTAALLILGFCRNFRWIYLAILAGSAAAGFLIGGEVGILYAHLDTETFMRTFLAVPEEPELLRQYARACGSIPGMLYGVLLGTFGCIAFELEHRRDTLPPRSRRIYALLWFLGGIAGLHWLYIGRWLLAVIQVFLSVFVFFNGNLVGFVFILPLLGLLPVRDRWGRPMSHVMSGNWIQWSLSAVLLVYCLFPHPCHARPKALKISCENNLRLIYNAIEQYRDDHGVDPNGFEVLALKPEILSCTVTHGRQYQFFPLPEKRDHDYPMIYDSVEAPHPHGTLVLWSDGRISSYQGKHYRGLFRNEKELYDTIMKPKNSTP